MVSLLIAGRLRKARSEQLVALGPQHGKFSGSRREDRGKKVLTSKLRLAPFLNSWNPEMAEQIFQSQAVGFLTKVDTDRVNLNPSHTESGTLSTKRKPTCLVRKPSKKHLKMFKAPGPEEFSGPFGGSVQSRLFRPVPSSSASESQLRYLPKKLIAYLSHMTGGSRT